MTFEELRTALLTACPRSTGANGRLTGGVAYRQFREGHAPDPPFICYLCTDDNDVIADNSNYLGIAGIDIEYYTDGKDPVGESLLESVLRDDLGLVWSKTEVSIEAEQMLEVVYSTQIVLTQSDESG
jgi:hypothetical protein